MKLWFRNFLLSTEESGETRMGISQSILEKKICDSIVDISKNPEWINVPENLYEGLRDSVESYYTTNTCSIFKMSLQTLLFKLNREINQPSFGTNHSRCPTLIGQVAKLIKLVSDLEHLRNKRYQR